MAGGSLVGTYVGGYLIEALLGRGGMGEVYLATQSRLDRRVAIKVLAPDLSADDAFRARFLRESRIASQLDHPNIVEVFDAGELDGRLYIVMRYISGTDLHRILQAERQLAPERAVFLLDQVAAALDTAHATGLVHRDVKPANIMVATPDQNYPFERAYLTDFGLTRMVGERPASEHGAIVGTLDYVAPEQTENAEIDWRADIYSLACVAFETLTGHRPFERPSPAALIGAHLHEPPPSVAAHGVANAGDVDRVIARGMAKDPEVRYQSASEFAAALGAALGSEPEHPDATAGVSGTNGDASPPRRIGRRGVALALLLIAAAGAVTFAATRRQAPAPTPTATSTPATADAPAYVRGLVASGQEFSCAITGDARVACWGSNEKGQLGRTGSSTEPGLVNGMRDAAEVVASDEAACALDTAGAVWCWGGNRYGELGTTPSRRGAHPTPQPIDIPAVTRLAAGGGHFCALASDRALYCWGLDVVGQSSAAEPAGPRDATIDANDRDYPARSRRPARVTAAPSGIVDVDAGTLHTCVRRVEGEIVCWGFNDFGQVTGTAPPGPTPAGIDDYVAKYSVVTPTVAGGANATALALGQEHTCIAVGSSIECWGRPGGDAPATPDPFKGAEVAALEAGFGVTCAVARPGVWCWGASDNPAVGPLQDGRTWRLTDVRSLSVGDEHACAVLSGGSVRCWGKQDARLGSAGPLSEVMLGDAPLSAKTA